MGRPFNHSLSIISDLEGHLTFERKGKGANRIPYSTLTFLYWKTSKSLLANKFADKNISGARGWWFHEIIQFSKYSITMVRFFFAIVVYLNDDKF